VSIRKLLGHSLVAGGAALCLVAGLAATASADRGEDMTPASHWKRSSTSEVGLLKSGFTFVTAIPYPGGYYDFFQKGPRLVRCAERLGDDGDQASGKSAGPAGLPAPPPFPGNIRPPTPAPQQGDGGEGCRELVE
jgi:hypothetical protein